MSKEHLPVQDYTKLAGDYDETRYTVEVDRFLDSFREEVFLELLQPNRSMKIIDVGTGTGSGISFFAERVKGFTGLDGTQAMLDLAQLKIDEAGLNNVDLVCANALEIPFENNTFDHVTSLNFIHLFAPKGIEVQAKFIAEMARIVKPGGSVIVEFDNYKFLELGNNYQDLEKMRGELQVDRVVGTYLPKTGKVSRFSQQLGKSFARLARRKLFRNYAYKWVVKYTKS